MIALERTQYIMSRLKENGVVTFKLMSQELNVSESTIRRDFDKLESYGKLHVVPGGAVLNSSGDCAKSSKILNYASVNNFEAKDRVARAASLLVEDGDCIFIDCGDNTACLAPYIQKCNIKIVTNSGLFVRSLTVQPEELIVLGGNYDIERGFSSGSLYQKTLKQFHFDKVFVSCSGINIEENTVYSSSYDALEAKSVALQNSEKVYLLFDSEKLSRRGFCKMGKISSYEKIICNRCQELSSDLPNLISV